MESSWTEYMISFDDEESVWDRFFRVNSLVLIGTRDECGDFNLAPKHMAMPMGWDNYFGFMCTDTHSTYHNVKSEKQFTVSYPRAEQVVLAGLGAAPRDDDNFKPSLAGISTRPADSVDGVFIEDGYAYLECILSQVVEGFGASSLIVGKVIQAHIHRDALRGSIEDDEELIHSSPLLAYLDPGRFVRVDESFAFPYPTDFAR